MATDTEDTRTENIHAGHRERLRHRYDKDRIFDSFAEHEILEFELSLVIPRRDVNGLAHTLISQFGSLASVLAASPAELKKVKGMTTSAAYMLGSMFSVIRRGLRDSNPDDRTPVFSGPESFIKYVQPFFLGRRTECYVVGFLDINYRAIRVEFKEGTAPDAVYLITSELIAKSIREGAKYVIIAHNHPSGSVRPSFDDIRKTKVIHDALTAMEVQLVDHVIFANQSDIFSFHNNGLLSKFEVDYEKSHNEDFEDSPAIRKIFLYQLNEFIMEPLQSFTDHIIVKPKDEVIKSMDNQNVNRLYQVMYACSRSKNARTKDTGLTDMLAAATKVEHIDSQPDDPESPDENV